MNTKKHLYMLLTGALALGLAACVDDNDWGTDSNYNRAFSAHDIQVTPSATTATVTFDALSSVDYYLLELNTDSLYLEEQHEGSRIETITSSPYVIEGLSGETKYFLRIRAYSKDGAQPSLWSYYEDGDLRSFVTDGEQIFYTIATADVTSSTIRLSWLEDAEVTRIVYYVADNPDDAGTERTLTADEIAASEVTITGLSAQTTYDFVIYNGDVKRGEISGTTSPEMPEGDLQYVLPDGVTLIDDALLEDLAAQAQEATGGATSYNVTIGVPGGTTISMHGVDDEGEETGLAIPEGMSVTFFALPGERPVLNFPKSLVIGGTHAYIRFEGVTIVDDGCQYLVNASDAPNVNEFTLTNCIINDMDRSIIRLQGDAATFGTINIDNCVVTNIGAGGYAVFRIDNAAYTIGSINITNSTFNNVSHNFIQAKKCNLSEVNLTGCTFYNVPNASDRYLVDADGNNTNVKVESTIFGMIGGKGIRTKGTTTILNVFLTSDCNFTGNNFNADITNVSLTSEELFADPANGDFTLQNNNIIRLGIGDPRWYEE